MTLPELLMTLPLIVAVWVVLKYALSDRRSNPADDNPLPPVF